jgi:uncharacterized protein (UPF0147 family)
MVEEKELAETVERIIRQMELLINDFSVPKNVRGAIADAKSRLSTKEAYIVRISSAIYSLDAVSGDINLPPQARTAIWNILSMLEAIKT